MKGRQDLNRTRNNVSSYEERSAQNSERVRAGKKKHRREVRVGLGYCRHLKTSRRNRWMALKLELTPEVNDLSHPIRKYKFLALHLINFCVC